jgi:K+ transporter
MPNAPMIGVRSAACEAARGEGQSRSIRVTARPGMARWREYLFTFMSRNSGSATNYVGLPLDQTVELGLGVEL